MCYFFIALKTATEEARLSPDPLILAEQEAGDVGLGFRKAHLFLRKLGRVEKAKA